MVIEEKEEEIKESVHIEEDKLKSSMKEDEDLKKMRKALGSEQ